MSVKQVFMNGSLSNPESISRFKKERFLLSMSEDKFRDEVVRPLLLRQGLKDGRDVCGVSEKGKDAIFFAEDKLGMQDMYVVQTKKGSLTMSRKVSDNVIEAITQLKTALQTSVALPIKHKKKFPTKAFLCSSGKVNDNARMHIVEQVGDPRIVFLDSDDLIPKIDEFFPEVWLGIDADIFPYLRAIRSSVESTSDNTAFSDTVSDGGITDAATDSMFVQLRLHRSFLKPEKRLGQITQNLSFEDLPVTGVLSRRERLVLILGEAGSGKSTSLKRLAYLLADKGLQSTAEFRIPVIIRATDVWARKERPLVEVMEECTKAFSKSVKSPFTLNDLNKGNVVVLLDALDELANDNARKNVIETVLAFNKLYPKCQVVITSRDYAFIKELSVISDFVQFRLSAINYKQAQQILKRFEKKKNLDPEKSNEILRRIQEVHGMDLNPLLVTVFAATSDYSRKDIPANITELFKKYTEMMLGRWTADKGIGQQYHAPLKDFLLQKVAYEMHQAKVTSLSLETFRAYIKTQLTSRGHLADFDQLFDEILYRSGLLRITGDLVEFRHLLIQEFFAGRGIPNEELLRTYVLNEWWQRAIVFYCGEHPEKSRVFETITKELNAPSSSELMTASVTVGLGLQACYLLETVDKLKFFPWVVESLSKAKDAMIKAGEAEHLPLSYFIHYYLVGRDAVACNLLVENYEQTATKILNSELPKDTAELRKFWIIVGLIEAGNLKKAKELIKNFHPVQTQLLLGLHLGCFLIQHLRVVSKEERALAKEICGMLAEPIGFMRGQLLKEFKSQLLEIRNGEVKAIENESSKEDGASKVIDV